MMGNLQGKAALVTGGTAGIGHAIAEALIDQGASVAIAARTTGDLERAEEELRERARTANAGTDRADSRVVAIRCDVRSEPECARMISAAVEALGHLDVLINNAGVGIFEAVDALTPEQWDTAIGTNLSGVYYCTHHALPHLKGREESWVINIGSLAGKNAFPGGAAYNASKFGLVGFSEALMQDVRHDGVRVSYIMPGSVASKFSHPKPGTGDEWKIQPVDIGRIVVDLLAMPGRTLPSRVEVRPSRPPRK